MTEPSPKVARCRWATTELNIPYHDEEWGVPVHNDHTWFEFLTLEGAQAGLSWDTVLKKRARYREVFANFDPRKSRPLRRPEKESTPGRPRHHPQPPENRRNHYQRPRFPRSAKRIRLVRQLHLAIRRRQTKTKRLKSHKNLPARTTQSDALSKDLRKRGFRFVGSTICYALMQATGMVNDHMVDCFRYKELRSATE